MTVSVVVPVRDGARYLAAALESVVAQSRPPVEIVVVDDGSQDESAELAGAAGALVLRRPAEGPAAARNAGAAAATGELLAFLDADDLAAPERLRVQAAALREDPGLDLVFGHLEEFLSPDRPELAGRVTVRPGRIPGLHVGAMLVRREVFVAEPMDVALHGGEFLDWYHRAGDRGLRSRMLDDVVLFRRIHGDNMTLTDPGVAAGYVGAARAAILRRRAGPS